MTNHIHLLAISDVETALVKATWVGRARGARHPPVTAVYTSS